VACKAFPLGGKSMPSDPSAGMLLLGILGRAVLLLEVPSFCCIVVTNISCCYLFFCGLGLRWDSCMAGQQSGGVACKHSSMAGGDGYRHMGAGSWAVYEEAGRAKTWWTRYLTLITYLKDDWQLVA